MTSTVKLLAITLILVATVGFLAFVPSQKDTDIIMLRTMEAPGVMSYPNQMVLTSPNGESETIELEKVKKNGSNSEENMTEISKKIAEIRSKGYELKEFSGGGGVYGITYVYYFEKK